MGTVLEDVTSESIDAEHIRRRVDDWEQRLGDLFACDRWLVAGRMGKPAKAPRSSWTRS